jgi:hypothetical protein
MRDDDLAMIRAAQRRLQRTRAETYLGQLKPDAYCQYCQRACQFDDAPEPQCFDCGRTAAAAAVDAAILAEQARSPLRRIAGFYQWLAHGPRHVEGHPSGPLRGWQRHVWAAGVMVFAVAMALILIGLCVGSGAVRRVGWALLLALLASFVALALIASVLEFLKKRPQPHRYPGSIDDLLPPRSPSDTPGREPTDPRPPAS